jgi:hypothetical protein
MRLSGVTALPMPRVSGYGIVCVETLHCGDVFGLEHLKSLPTNLVFVEYVKRLELFAIPTLVILIAEGSRKP